MLGQKLEWMSVTFKNEEKKSVLTRYIMKRLTFITHRVTCRGKGFVDFVWIAQVSTISTQLLVTVIISLFPIPDFFRLANEVPEANILEGLME